ncbi:UDP-phosphate alpha-N-acetyl-D-fucosaminephosphotransferase [Leucobacter sp. W1478]|uniref:UDP-phosphate alpha-N-acetyl-D-fucosaminephosphotransferase n=1 Tax=Leucobacter sp. W1478 TaxID=3439065 RepID=UPI003F37FFC1
MIALISGLITLGLSLVLPFVIKPLLIRLGVMDVPSERSSHERPILRGLGLAVLISMLIGGLFALLSSLGFIGSAQHQWGSLVVIVAASLASGLLGLGEDLKGVSVAARSVLLLTIATAAAGALVWGSGGWTAELPVPLQLLLALYAILFVSSYINVANFMDGLNGISGLHGLVSGATFFAAGMLSELWWLQAAGLILAAGYLGFLPWNLTKPGAFLGDVGSYLLGGAVAVTSFAALVAGVPILASIGPMIIYFGDVGVTLVKRVRAGHKWDEPHKEHVYQRIQQMGYSHVQASGLVAAFTALASGLGLASFCVSPIWWIGLLVAGLGVLAVYLRLPRILPTR